MRKRNTVMKKPFKRQRIGAGKAPVLLLVLLLCGFFLEARGDGLIPMFPEGTAGLIRGGIRFDMLPEEVEAVENANGLAPFQVARAFTLSCTSPIFSDRIHGDGGRVAALPV